MEKLCQIYPNVPQFILILIFIRYYKWKQVNLEQEHIDKAREVIDMLEFTKEDGKDVIYVNVGDNVQVKIVR